MKKLCILIFVCISLQGCVFLVGAAAGVASAVVVYDHRKIEKILMDERLAQNVMEHINANETLHQNAHIKAHCFNQVLLLTGQATTQAQKDLAGEIAHEVPDIKRIYNQISIKGPTSNLTRASDTWITTKIKTQMIATKGLSSGSIKVITENGTVYLMGSTSHEQADVAVEITRQVAGVQRVVKLFQYSD